LKRTIGHLYPEHFSAEVAPKKQEAVASPLFLFNRIGR